MFNNDRRRMRKEWKKVRKEDGLTEEKRTIKVDTVLIFLIFAALAQLVGMIIPILVSHVIYRDSWFLSQEFDVKDGIYYAISFLSFLWTVYIFSQWFKRRTFNIYVIVIIALNLAYYLYWLFGWYYDARVDYGSFLKNSLNSADRAFYNDFIIYLIVSAIVVVPTITLGIYNVVAKKFS